MAYKLYDAEIEYLESTGRQYINLPFGFDKTDEIYFSFSVKTTQTNDKYMNSPTSWNNNNNRFGMGVHLGGYYTFAYGNQLTGYTNLLPRRVNDGAIHNWVYKNYICSVTDLNISRDCSSYTFGATTANLRLFFGYNSNTSGKVAYYKHIKNGVVVVELIPVRIGTIGYLFDKVSGQLFGNSGTGDFVLGPDVAPAAYANEIAFLESTGSQYIDTGIKPTNNTRFVITMDLPRMNVNDLGAWFFGSRNGAGEAQCGVIYDRRPSVRAWQWVYGNNQNVYSVEPVSGITVFDNYTTSGANELKINDLTLSVTANTFTGNYNFYLFTYNNAGNPILANILVGQKLISAKLYEGTTLVRDFIPVEYNNIGYMYDKVSGEFFANQGTGKFVLGHRAPRFDGKACARSYTRRQLMAENYVGHAPAGYKWVDYIENTSTAFINTGVAANVISRIECSMRMNTLRDHGNANNYFGSQGSQLILKVLTNNRFLINWHSTSSVYDFNNNVWNQRITIICDYPSNSATVGKTTKSMKAQAITETSNLLIMRCLTNTTSLNYSGFMTCWWFKVYDNNGALIRDYVPIMRLSDSKYGLWDKVNKTFNISPNNVLFNGGNDQ